MKTIYRLTIIMIALVLCISCNDEWKDEQFKQLVSFKANINSKGVTPIYVRYKGDGKVTYQVPLIVSGSTVNDKNMSVQVGIDHDTLNVLNQERFSSRTELFYKELPSQYFEMPKTTDIAAGNPAGLFPVSFSLVNLDLVDKWVLPLTIEDDPSNNYTVNTRKNYRKALLRVFPFNNYSGVYDAALYKMYFPDKDGKLGDPMTTKESTAYVVDENTVFFYAGLRNEEYQDRKFYKIFAKFNADNTLTLTTDNPQIKLQLKEGALQSYRVDPEMDATLPYLKKIYVTLRIAYSFEDYTSVPGYPIKCTVEGTLTMLRKINIQIPDEDQAIEW